MMFCELAQETFKAEATFHAEFMAFFDTTIEAELRTAVQAPNNVLYTSRLLAVIHERPFYEGLAALLPCFKVYLEVGRHLKQHGSSNALYQTWIDKYGGETYGAIVERVMRLTDAVAADLTEEQRACMREHFHLGCRMEYAFWTMAYEQQAWPI